MRGSKAKFQTRFGSRSVLGGVATLVLVVFLLAESGPVGVHSSSLRLEQATTTTIVPTAGPQGLPTVDGGMNVEPSMRPWHLLAANPDGWWCRRSACWHHRDPIKVIGAEMKLARRLKVVVLRLEFPWFLIEPRAAVFAWRRADAIVRMATKLHVQLEPVLVFAPPWAAAAPNDVPRASDFAAFVRKIVHRYKGTVHYWEMWNEPNLPQYLLGSVTKYVSNVLVPGYHAAKAADPKARVVLGAPSSPNLEWLKKVYTGGGGGSFDVMAFHSYADAGRTLAGARAIEDLLRTEGQGAKSLWLGEYGVQEKAVDDRRQIALMTAVMTADTPIRVAIWYNLRDDYAESCCPVRRVKTGYWGLLQHDAKTKKRGFSAMRTLINLETAADKTGARGTAG